MDKKLVYAEHLAAFDRAAQSEGNGDVPDMSNFDPSDLADSGGLSGVPSPGNMGQTFGGREPFAGRQDIHPSLRKYSNVVNVVGDDA